ncbi:MAG: T9SS type A sorting domain-containing protein [Bacteroidota bacterium]|nr:T9SS type A sorting domain-containing protein [Bacteroidota bacterium]MDW8138342.1 T9SS type A sorting domain-containing protein [Bacteroidota bacterium]
MRGKKLVLYLGALGCVLGGRSDSLLIPPKPPLEALEHPAEDPEARVRWEWMRLRNPRTGRIPDDIRARELAFAEQLPRAESFRKGPYPVALSWTHRGPINIGGRTRALAIDRTDENVLLAGGVSGGLWRSADGGQSWTKVTDPEDLHSITCIVQDPRPGKTHIWYYGTGELVGNSARGGGAPYRGDGIFRSVDGGRTWRVLESTSTRRPHAFDQPFDYVWNLAVDPSNWAQDELYAATYGRIFRSLDGGRSWTAVLGAQEPSSLHTDVAVTPQGVVYATLGEASSIANVQSPSRGIWRSPDGVNWTPITPSGWPTNYRRIVIGIAPSNPNIVYFLAETPGSGVNGHSLWRYTYLSGDGSGSGGRWENRSFNLPRTFDSQGSYDLVIAVKPDDPNVVFIGGTNLYRSLNGFAEPNSFTHIGGYAPSGSGLYPNHHPDQHALQFRPSNPRVLYTGSDGGVHRTDDCLASTVRWTSLNNGYLTTQFYTIALRPVPADPLLIGGMQDNGTWATSSFDGQTPWRSVLGGDGAYCAISRDGLSRYVSAQNGVTYRITYDASGRETGWTRIDPAGGAGYLFINPFALDPNDDRVFYVAGGQVLWRNENVTAIPMFRSEPASTNWTALEPTYVSEGVITALAPTAQPAHRVYYGTSTGRLFRLDRAHEPGSRPVDITGPQFPRGAYVSALAPDPENGDRLLVVFSNYEVPSLFYTADGGRTWMDVSGNLEEHPDGSGSGPSVRWAVITSRAGRPFYLVGTSTGLYSAEALEGRNTVWRQEGARTIGNVVVSMLAARPEDGFVAVATHGNGVYAAYVDPGPAAPLGAPELLHPAPNSAGHPVRLELIWRPVSGALSYEVQVSPDPGFMSPVLSRSGWTETRYALSGLRHFTTYFWRVRALGPRGAGPWSAVRTFTTVVGPPDLMSPPIGAGAVPLPVSLAWAPSAGATRYHVQVAREARFQSVIWQDSLLSQPSVRAPDLAHGQTYFWRVRARNADGVSPWSAVGRFTTQLEPPSWQPPAGLEPHLDPRQLLRWSPVTGASGYQLQVSRDADFAALLVDAVLSAPSWRPEGLTYGLLYHLRVRALAPEGPGAWSAIWMFRLEAPPVVSAEASGRPADYELAPVFPNPFQAYAVVRFGLPRAAEVHLELFDASGRLLRALFRGPLEAGRYQVGLEGASLAAGLYLVRLRTPEAVRAQKLIRLP